MAGGSGLIGVSNYCYNRMMSEMTDAECVRRLADGDSMAMAILVKRYESPLRRYVMRLCLPCAPWQDDLLQECFLKLYRNIHDYDPSLSFSAWLYRIAHNVVVDHIRAQSRRPQASVSFEEGGEGEDLFTGARFRPEERVERSEFQRAVRRILGLLPPPQRAAFVLRFLEEKEYEEIGDILQQNVNTVATWIRRSRELFREEAQKAGLKMYWEDEHGSR